MMFGIVGGDRPVLTFINVGTIEEKEWWLKVTLEEFLENKEKYDCLDYYHEKYLKEDGLIFMNRYGGCNSFIGSRAIEEIQSDWFPAK